MAATISWDALRELARFSADKGCAISLYVDLDPSNTPTAGDADRRVRSLLDEGHKSAAAARTDFTHEEREALRGDFERLGHFFEHEFSRDGAHGFAVFCAGFDNLWRALPLAESVDDEIKVNRQLYLTPLVPLVGRGEGAVVAHVSREQGRFFRLRGGRLEDIADHFEEQPGQHDQGGLSQRRYQRHIENLVQEHLRTVADDLSKHIRSRPSQQIVVICAEEMRGEFAELLSNEARNAVVGWTQAEAHAGPAELLEVVLPELERGREGEERQSIERWREEAGRGGRATSGWGATLEAASDGRVELLLAQRGVERTAWQCPQCGRASVDGGRCPLDGSDMEERAEGLDLAVHQTLVNGGMVWSVQHHQDLEPVEGIGALLRY